VHLLLFIFHTSGQFENENSSFYMKRETMIHQKVETVDPPEESNPSNPPWHGMSRPSIKSIYQCNTVVTINKIQKLIFILQKYIFDYWLHVLGRMMQFQKPISIMQNAIPWLLDRPQQPCRWRTSYHWNLLYSQSDLWALLWCSVIPPTLPMLLQHCF